jgi:hypothetical protein
MIANLTQNLSKAARATGIAAVWHRVPITTVTVLLILCTWFYSRVTLSSAANSAPPAIRLTALEYPPLALLQPMPLSFRPDVRINTGRAHVRKGRAPMATGRAHSSKVAHSEFRKKIVGQNEIDYVAKDVTIRLFLPAPLPKPSRVARGERIVKFGKDVTVRYFDDPEAPSAKTRPVAAPTQSTEGPLAVSK